MSNKDKDAFKVVEYKKNKKINYEEEFRNIQKRLHSPKVDLFERDYSYFVKIELPGVDSDSLEISFKDDQIVFVSGSKVNNFILNTDKIKNNSTLSIALMVSELVLFYPVELGLGINAEIRKLEINFLFNTYTTEEKYFLLIANKIPINKSLFSISN